MKPRNLRLLMIEDIPRSELMSDDLVYQLPVDIEHVEHWRDFVRRFESLVDFDLLGVDCKFNLDATSPSYPLPAFQVESLKGLAWPMTLHYAISGLLIGATAVGVAVGRKLPVAAALYTGDPSWAYRDVPSLMLAAQIYAACRALVPTGADWRGLRTTSTEALLEDTAQLVRDNPGSCGKSLPGMVVGYRESLKRRLGLGAGSDTPSLWADEWALAFLLNVFESSESEEQLDKELHKTGIEIWDSDGVTTSLDLRSLFLDQLIVLPQIGRRLPLASVGPNGPVRNYVTDLLEFNRRGMTEVRAFLDNPNRTVNEAILNPVQRLVALLCAWCDEYYASYDGALTKSWDPLAWEPSAAGFPTLRRQLQAVLGELQDLDHGDGVTENELYRHLNQVCGETKSPHFLTGPLAYDGDRVQRGSDRRVLDMRRSALRQYLSTLQGMACVQRDGAEEEGRYKALERLVPNVHHVSVSRAGVARRLGFPVEGAQNRSYPSRVGEIIKKAGLGDSTRFLSDLERRPLPQHLRHLCEDFIVWRLGRQPEFWPPCLQQD